MAKRSEQESQQLPDNFAGADLVRAIQAFLRYRRNEWAVLVALGLKEDPVLRWKRRGLLISSDHLEEHWDKALLRERLGQKFPW